MSIAAAFPLDVGDACGNFFGTALRACAPPLPADGRCLEIGCAEFDVMKYATQAWPAMTFTGIDWRSAPREYPRTTVVRGDVMEAERRATSSRR